MLQDEVLYEVDANPEIWMIAGRTMGHALLSNARGLSYLIHLMLLLEFVALRQTWLTYASNAGSRTEITVTCMPLVSGHVRPPQLGLPAMDDANISCNPPGPHLVCVLPPTLSSSYCIPAWFYQEFVTCIHVANYSVQFWVVKLGSNRTCSNFDRVFACTIILVHVNCMPKRMSCGCVVARGRPA